MNSKTVHNIDFLSDGVIYKTQQLRFIAQPSLKQ